MTDLSRCLIRIAIVSLVPYVGTACVDPDMPVDPVEPELVELPAVVPELVVEGRTWKCEGIVNYDRVRVSVNTGATRTDAVHFDCSGRIGSLEIDAWSGDGIKIHQGARDLRIEGGYVKQWGCPNDIVHLDGIQAMGGTRVTFRNFLVDGTAARTPSGGGCAQNSALYINEGAGGNGTPTDIVFYDSVFKKRVDRNRTVRIGDSVRSGIVNSTVYWSGPTNPGGAVWINAAVDPINTNTTILRY